MRPEEIIPSLKLKLWKPEIWKREKTKQITAEEIIRRKRSRRKLQKTWEEYKGAVIWSVVLLAVTTSLALLFPETEVLQPEESKKMEDFLKQPEAPRIFSPFNITYEDWDGGIKGGFTSYQIPEDYEKRGGALSETMQIYTYCTCRHYEVDYATVLAMFEMESGYRQDADNDGAVGYMQIIPTHHWDRMERLKVTDIRDPYQNIKVGVDYLAELLEKYDGDYERALTAYRWGATGAQEEYFSQGQTCSKYSQAVLETAGRIRAKIEMR